MKDHSILRRRLKVHAQIALAVPIQPDTRAASSAAFFFFLPLAFWVSGQRFDLLLSSPHSSSSTGTSQLCFVPRSRLGRGTPASPQQTLGAIRSAAALGADQMTSDTILLCLCGFLNDLLEVYITESLLKEV